MKVWLREYKRTLVCSDCGFLFKDYPQVCDFHHTDRDRDKMGIRKAILNSRERLLKEVEVCVPLCANCHRIRHGETNHD